MEFEDWCNALKDNLIATVDKAKSDFNVKKDTKYRKVAVVSYMTTKNGATNYNQESFELKDDDSEDSLETFQGVFETIIDRCDNNPVIVLFYKVFNQAIETDETITYN